MRVLVACEYSGIVRDAFIRRGHYALSCDLLPTERPGPHYQGDVRDILYDDWDMVIAFPPCTHLAVSGAAWFEEKRKDGRQQEGIDFFMLFTEIKIERVAIENPVGIMSSIYKPPSQIIQPWQFGDSYQKTTCLWLKNLPRLKPTKIVDPGEFVTYASGCRMPKWYAELWGDGKGRSKIFPGIAEAMAEQWGQESMFCDLPLLGGMEQEGNNVD